MESKEKSQSDFTSAANRSSAVFLLKGFAEVLPYLGRSILTPDAAGNCTRKFQSVITLASILVTPLGTAPFMKAVLISPRTCALDGGFIKV